MYGSKQTVRSRHQIQNACGYSSHGSSIDPDNGSFIGCITCDITLDTVQNSLSQVKISNDGALLLVDSTGIYIYNSNDLEAAANAVTLASDPFTSPVASQVTSSGSGTLQYAGKNFYFDTIPEVGWKLAIVVEQDKINEVSDMVSDVSNIAQDQKGVSDTLSDIVSQFRL